MKVPHTLFSWVLLYLLSFSVLLMPIVFSWYGVRARRFAGRIRQWASRVKGRAVAATRRRLWRWLTGSTADDPPQEAPPATPLHPRP
ncbi:hypothetical protein GA0115237_111983 [Streptomyces sp. ScaeMP-6W]|uniref:hypothetical protein n=1 Tax=unclassified Streptomyces TaxID=2593676 RepID=UPI00081F2468|nr:hypothetical protein [Streptomyces sp. ScaeMP-6W]SCE34281.1 hypothetical protein GA0115237_111983 [Streptomyces sp. ScaeMP-6W]